ncbi:MAG: ComF family protein [Beijerinckiaceae bacterium]
MGLFRSARLATLDLVYPPLCVACGEITSQPATLCAACWRQMPFISRPYCERLGTPFNVDIGGPLLSPAAIADPPVFDRARAVAHHNGAARDMVHKLKYGDRQELAIAMGQLMATSAAEVFANADVLVPVPLHWTRLWQRRFNQAAALANVISVQTGIACDPTLLRRRKRTLRQVGLTRPQRQQNLQGAFVVPESTRAAVMGRRVVLIDDVMTTGSTANASARALIKAGASAVDFVTFSRVVTGA